MKDNTAKETVRDQFNRQSEKFSNWSVTRNEEYARYYYDFCKMTPEDRLLDVSCGSGEFCIFCAPKISHATGVDLSENMVALAEQQSRESGITNTTFKRGDAVDLPNQSGLYSIVVSKSAFHHYSEHDVIFKEMIRCCRQKGRISIQDIVAYEDKDVNDFFESFERLVDASHGATCSKSFIMDRYREHNVGILSMMEVAVDLHLSSYLDHAVRSDKDTALLRQLIEEGLKENGIKSYFHHKENDLYFKRNVFIILGQKYTD